MLGRGPAHIPTRSSCQLASPGNKPFNPSVSIPIAIAARIIPMTRVTTPMPDSPSHFEMGAAKVNKSPQKAASATMTIEISTLLYMFGCCCAATKTVAIVPGPATIGIASGTTAIDARDFASSSSLAEC